MQIHPADAVLAAIASHQEGVTTRRSAARVGMDNRMVRTRLRAGLLREPVPGVLVFAAAPETWRQQLWIVTQAGRGSAVSHRAAARLHAIDGFADEAAIEASVLANQRLAVPGAIVHRVVALDRCDVTSVDGLPVTGLARTLADLGSVVGEDRVLQAFDDVRRRGKSLRWLGQTATRLHRPGQAGTGTLRRLLDQAEGEGVAPESWFERLLERCLCSRLLPPLTRQYVVRDNHGRFVARLDVAMPDIKLGLEAHSRRYHAGSVFETADEGRDLRLAALGWEVLYVGWQGVHDPDALLELVLAAAAQRTRT